MAIEQPDIVLRHIRQLIASPETADQSDAQLLQRFAAYREEDAFAALVQRYGRLVWDICRRVLGDFHDAEDAFQATFLVLARKAESVRKREALASWLHGVSYRVALQARRNAAVRRKHERQSQSMAVAKSLPDDVLREALALLDEEVQRLPIKERAAFVLRCLEGKSQAETARQLGWKEGTVSAMLARARQRLRQRLTNRGVTLSGVLAALALGEEVRAAALPAGLVQATLNATVHVAAGGTAPTALTSKAAALAEVVTKAMFMRKVQTLTFLVLAFGLLSVGATLQIHRAFADPGLRAESGESGAAVVAATPAAEVKRTDKSPEAKAADIAGEVFTYTGRVLGPDGKPLAKARLFIHGLTPGVVEFRKRAESAPDGTFRFSVRRDEFGDKGVVPLGRSQPAHRGLTGRRHVVHPGDEILNHEAFQAAAGIIGVVGVPGLMLKLGATSVQLYLSCRSSVRASSSPSPNCEFWVARPGSTGNR
jgi:RNA polymerase sigma factor (sigma-70 family)